MERRSGKGRGFLVGCLLSLAAVVAPPAVGVGVAQVTPGVDQTEARRFIVTLRDDVGDPAAVANEHSARHGAEVSYIYRHALRGYAATFAGKGLSDVAGDARVVRVEPDGPVTASVGVTQSSATWGLDRIDQRKALDKTFTYDATGAGVTAYIIDTGLLLGHSEFGGRATSGYDAFGGSGEDCNGHGTHVGGTVGGATYGVAKGVSLVGVRVLDCAGSGSWAGVIGGIDYVTGRHTLGRSAVANMSLGGGANASVDDAVRRSIAAGVSYAIAAGNGNTAGVGQDACRYLPARVGEAMTIGATDNTDRKASWSNYGKCLDWFAPGVDITSAWHTTATGTNMISGTSMASPHTAGVAALYLQKNPGASAAAVRNGLFNLATPGVVTSSKTGNNHLLYTNL